MKHNTVESFEVFLWNKNFETGIALIDEQHQKLVALLNQLAAHIANQSSSVKLNKVFAELADYAHYHFQAEESIWQERLGDDPWYTRHHHSHQAFMTEVARLKAEEKEKPLYDVISDIVRFLTHWLAFHILDNDRRMAIAVLGVESGMAIEEAKNHSDATMSGSIDVLIDTVLMMYDSLSVRTMQLMREKMARRRAEAELKIDQERWQFVMESAGDEIWEWDIVQDNVYRADNSLSILGVFGEHDNSSERTSKVHSDDLPQVRAALQAHLDGKTDVFANEHRLQKTDGSYYWVLTRGKVIMRDKKGKPLRMIGIHINITEREIASLLYQNSSEAMMVTDEYNNIINVNPAFSTITGYALQEVVGKTAKILKSERHSPEFYREIKDSIEITGQWQGEIWSRRKNGTVYPEWLTINNVYNPDKSVHYRIALFSDITERKLSEQAVWKKANFDALTGLPNRQMFYDRFSMELKAAGRNRQKLALLFIDLDHFKEVNDSLGHTFGDLLLIETSKRLKSCVRETDTVARLSGDEFIIILSTLESQLIVERVAQHVLDILKEPFLIESNVIYISASIGITLYPDDGVNEEDLFRNADQAMYQAKKNGRDRSSFFTLALQQAAQNRMRVANDLRSALGNNEFKLLYQPIIHLSTGGIDKAEALVRWQHPEKGLVCPDDFISIAEDTGMIHEIGNWVFFEAARQTLKWQSLFSPVFKISVNKSPVQFHVNDETQNNWLTYLSKLGLTGDSIIVEITESLLLDSSESVLSKMEQYNRAGIEVSLDDFGTGFSSLAYLQKFDIDYIKIDRSFVSDLSPTSKNLTLCKAMIMMAHALGIQVIAEGIETEEQKDLLKAIDCDYGQGYLFSRPVPAEDFEKLLFQLKSGSTED